MDFERTPNDATSNGELIYKRIPIAAIEFSFHLQALDSGLDRSNNTKSKRHAMQTITTLRVSVWPVKVYKARDTSTSTWSQDTTHTTHENKREGEEKKTLSFCAADVL